MPRMTREQRKQRNKYRRARVRHFLFTIGPDRVLGGRVSKRHHAQSIHINEHTIVNPHWPKAFDGLRIGHVSDFHLGDLLPLDKAIECIDMLAQQQPDVIACTGDVVDLDNHDAPPLLEALAAVQPPLGVYLVLGNHDELHDADALVQMAEHAGITVLRDEAVRAVRRGEGLVIAGIEWQSTVDRLKKSVEQTCGDETHVLLAHNPKAFLQARKLSIALTLAGHTHGGQVAMRNSRDTNLSITHRRSAGLYEDNGCHLFVTTGVGSWFPLRVNCPAEIAILTMRHGETPTLRPEENDKTNARVRRRVD